MVFIESVTNIFIKEKKYPNNLLFPQRICASDVHFTPLRWPHRSHNSASMMDVVCQDCIRTTPCILTSRLLEKKVHSVSSSSNTLCNFGRIYPCCAVLGQSRTRKENQLFLGFKRFLETSTLFLKLVYARNSINCVVRPPKKTKCQTMLMYMLNSTNLQID